MNSLLITFMSDLDRVLNAAGLSSRLAEFEDEALTLELLKSMRGMLRDNLSELGLTPLEIDALEGAMAANEAGGAALSPTSGGSGAAAPSPSSEERDCSSPAFAERVAELQAELFCEDLLPPPGAHLWPEEALRVYFESGGDTVPSTDSESSAAARAKAVLPCQGKLTAAAAAAAGGVPVGRSTTPRAPAPEALRGPPAPPAPPVALRALRSSAQVTGPIVGRLPIRWGTHEETYEFGASTTVGVLYTSPCRIALPRRQAALLCRIALPIPMPIPVPSADADADARACFTWPRWAISRNGSTV